ncbi:CDC50/LEM3 family, partial [Blyttiomyces helicus]
DTAFKQQRLKAWQPILTPKTVLPTFFAIGAVFIPLGIGLFIASEKVDQVMFEYTQCKFTATSNFTAPTSNYGPITQWKYDPTSQTCTVQFSVGQNFQPPVYLYYRLTNFYQNHRKYVKSFDTNQLRGDLVSTAGGLTSNCDPLRAASQLSDPSYGLVKVNGVETNVSSTAQIYPCGLIANSFFSDDIGNLTCVAGSFTDSTGTTVTCSPNSTLQTTYPFFPDGIAWPSDGDKYKLSQWNITRPDDIPTNLVPPPMWRQAFPQWKDGYNSSNFPNLNTNTRFQVWMRTAGLPNFRKLWGKNSTPLPAATYEISIVDNFDVSKFSGTKSIVISTVSILGGKNPFLGIAYISVGSVCWFLGTVFLIRNMMKPRKLGDHTYLSWNQPQNNRAGAAGGADTVN